MTPTPKKAGLHRAPARPLQCPADGVALSADAERLLFCLETLGAVSEKCARDELLYTDPAGLICELREAGQLVYTVRHTDSSGVQSAVYHLQHGHTM